MFILAVGLVVGGYSISYYGVSMWKRYAGDPGSGIPLAYLLFGQVVRDSNKNPSHSFPPIPDPNNPLSPDHPGTGAADGQFGPPALAPGSGGGGGGKESIA